MEGKQTERKSRRVAERSYEFSLEIVRFSRRMCQNEPACYPIRNQLIRSGTSVGANVAEAKSGRSRKDFGNFLNHALKSANETTFWLRIIKDSEICNGGTAESLMRESDEIAKMIAASLITMRKSKS